LRPEFVILRRLSPLVLLAAATAAVLAWMAAGLPSPFESGAWRRSMAWIMAEQKAFHDQLTGALKALGADGGLSAALWLVAGSAAYGVFHAAGPGHGKAVLTTYLLTNRDRLPRGMAMAVAAAFLQGLVAIVLVYGLVYLAGWVPRDAAVAVDWSERFSYALIAGLGLYLAWRAIRGLWPLVIAPSAPDHVGHHHHGDHDAGHAHGHDDHVHDESCGCGHAHGPSAEQLEQAGDWRTTLGVVLSIGMRPCSGAVLVLVFARALQIPWAGVAGVAAMSAGTAATVMALAALAVFARDRAVALVGSRSAGGLAVAANTVALAGGALLIAVGVSLLSASFAPTHPFGV